MARLIRDGDVVTSGVDALLLMLVVGLAREIMLPG